MFDVRVQLDELQVGHSSDSTRAPSWVNIILRGGSIPLGIASEDELLHPLEQGDR